MKKNKLQLFTENKFKIIIFIIFLITIFFSLNYTKNFGELFTKEKQISLEEINYNDLVFRDGLLYKKFSENLFTGKSTGKIQSEFVAGISVGTFKQYHDNGNLFESGYFSNGKLDGRHKVYHANGNIKEEGLYVDGKKYGLFNFYQSNGYHKAIEYFHGKKNGLQREMFMGKIKKSFWYEHGELYESKSFYSSGQLEYKELNCNYTGLKYQSPIGPKQIGIKIEYYPNGQLKVKKYTLAGKLGCHYLEVGESLYYKENGNLVFRHYYNLEGNQHGEQLWYADVETNPLKSKHYYVDGKEEGINWTYTEYIKGGLPKEPHEFLMVSCYKNGKYLHTTATNTLKRGKPCDMSKANVAVSEMEKLKPFFKDLEKFLENLKKQEKLTSRHKEMED